MGIITKLMIAPRRSLAELLEWPEGDLFPYATMPPEKRSPLQHNALSALALGELDNKAHSKAHWLIRDDIIHDDGGRSTIYIISHINMLGLIEKPHDGSTAIWPEADRSWIEMDPAAVVNDSTGSEVLEQLATILHHKLHAERHREKPHFNIARPLCATIHREIEQRRAASGGQDALEAYKAMQAELTPKAPQTGFKGNLPSGKPQL